MKDGEKVGSILRSSARNTVKVIFLGALSRERHYKKEEGVKVLTFVIPGGEVTIMPQFMNPCFAKFVSINGIGILLIFASYALCSASILPEDMFDISTEPPEQVEVFDPQRWVSIGASMQKIQIEMLKVETRIKLRYGRTRIRIKLVNSNDKPLQSSFRIILPENAFFTEFKMKRDKGAKFYTANVTRKSQAIEMFHFGHIKTNGTVSTGFIELSNDKDISSYNLKFTLGPGIHIQAFLMYERQVDRKDDLYSDTLNIFPMENSVIRMVHINVEVEEIENVTSLRCSTPTEKSYHHCRGIRRKKRDARMAQLDWRKVNVTTGFLKKHPFEFLYELEKQNTTSAVVLTQTNGNLHFVHLFDPQNLPVIRKHIVFLLDISDSMHGKKLIQLKWSMTEILDDLSSEDFFSIITFSVEATVWSPFKGDRRKCPLPLPVSESRYRNDAIDYINNIVAHGVTNIYSGLMEAFDVIQLFSPDTEDTCGQSQNINTPSKIRAKLQEKLPENVESMIFFLSDGTPTTGIRDSKTILELFTHLNHHNLTKPIQIHTIAYGEAADVHFLKALSSYNFGTMKKINVESAADVELTNFYTEVSSQVLSKIRTVASINGTGGIIQLTQPISSKLVLVKGSEVITAGQLFPELNQTELLGQPTSNFHWSTEASSKTGNMKYTSQIHDCRSMARCVDRIDFYLSRLQAYQLLKKLMDRDTFVRVGYLCPKSYNDDAIYRGDLINYSDYELTNYTTTDCVNPYKEKIIELALKEQFITPYTAFILSTESHVDIGLLGSIDYGGSTTQGQSDSGEIRTIDIPHGGNLQSHDQNLSTHHPTIEEPLPAASKIIGMNKSHYEAAEVIPLVTAVNEGSHNRTWLTKAIREYVASLVKILVGKPLRKHDGTNYISYPIGPPFD